MNPSRREACRNRTGSLGARAWALFGGQRSPRRRGLVAARLDGGAR
jgi:hypothetical protein